MPRMYKHELTEIEILCGITLEQVAELLPLVLVRDNKVIVPENTGPALAASVSRAALGVPVIYAGPNQLGLQVYQRADEPIDFHDGGGFQ